VSASVNLPSHHKVQKFSSSPEVLFWHRLTQVVAEKGCKMVVVVVDCCCKRTEPRPQVTCTENFMKFVHVVFEIYECTDLEAAG